MKSLSGYLRTRKLKRILERPPYIFDQQVEGTEIRFVVHTWIEYHNRARDSYTGEPDMVEFIKGNLKTGDVFWDIGANVGAYALLAAKLIPNLEIFAFEPYIPTYAHLWDNIAINRCNDSVVPLCMGLSDLTRMDRLGVSDPRAGSSEHVLGGGNFDVTQPSIAMRGDDAIGILGVKTPSVVKMDVDGYEVRVLRGMSGMLNGDQLRSMIIEVDERSTATDVGGMMKSHGFEPVSDSQSFTGAPVFNVVYQRR